MTFKKSEIKYILYSVLFLIVWFFIVIPIVIPMFSGDNSLFQFIFLNIGLVFFFQIFLKSLTTTSKINIMTAIGLVMVIVTLDIIIPDYKATIQGDCIVGNAILAASSSDYNFCLLGKGLGITQSLTIPDIIVNIINIPLSLLNNLLGLGIPLFVNPFIISMTYIFTYFIIPIVLLTIAALLIKDFVKLV